MSRARFRRSRSVRAQAISRSRPILTLRGLRGTLGPPDARAVNASAVRRTRAAVLAGIATAFRAARPAAWIGLVTRSEAALRISIVGLGSSGSQGFSGSFIGVPRLFGSSRIVPTSTAATPSTRAWWVFEI